MYQDTRPLFGQNYKYEQKLTIYSEAEKCQASFVQTINFPSKSQH